MDQWAIEEIDKEAPENGNLRIELNFVNGKIGGLKFLKGEDFRRPPQKPLNAQGIKLRNGELVKGHHNGA